MKPMGSGRHGERTSLLYLHSDGVAQPGGSAHGLPRTRVAGRAAAPVPTRAASISTAAAALT